jgi:hypothetical protein
MTTSKPGGQKDVLDKTGTIAEHGIPSGVLPTAIPSQNGNLVQSFALTQRRYA